MNEETTLQVSTHLIKDFLRVMNILNYNCFGL